jgi:tetratricopeptide (TPR) repeat protein
MGWVKQLGNLLQRRKLRPDSKESILGDLAHQDPENANAHLKLAEVYQKKGEKQKAVGEYLLAADLFTKNQFYGRALGIYKQLCRRDPSLDQVYRKMAEIYRQKGCLADAFHQYRVLARYYEDSGELEKSRDILKIMGEIDPPKNEGQVRGDRGNTSPERPAEPAPPGEILPLRSFDLGEALTAAEPLPVEMPEKVSVLEMAVGVEEIFKELKELGGSSAADPHFNYNLGIAYRELGFFDEARGQFEIAVRKRQKPFEALSMLGFCYWEKGMGDEAQQSFEKALGLEGITRERLLSGKYILSLLYQERGQTEGALRLLQEIATMDKGFMNAPDEILDLMSKVETKGIAKLKTSVRA